MTLTAVVLASNEEENVKELLPQLSFCDEIIVINDESSDQTVSVAKKYGCKVYNRALNNDFASQRNYALKKVSSEWILFIDADERISNKLKNIIIRAMNKSFDAYYIKRNDIFYHKQLRYGSWSSQHIRLGKRSVGTWKRKVHEIWDVSGKVGIIEEPILHYSHNNLTSFVADIANYAQLHADENKSEGKRSYLLKIVFWPFAKFIKNFVLFRGYKDGVYGFIYAVMMSFHSFLSWTHIYFKYEQN